MVPLPRDSGTILNGVFPLKKITAATLVEQPRLFDVRMAAHYLTTSVWGVRELIYSRAIPHIRIGKKILIPKEASTSLWTTS